MNFNEKLINSRTSNGLSQVELGALLQIDTQTIYKWETGESYPTFENLLQLSTIYSISLDELIGCESTKDTTKNQSNEIYNLLNVINASINPKTLLSIKHIFSGYCKFVYWIMILSFVGLLTRLIIDFLQ